MSLLGRSALVLILQRDDELESRQAQVCDALAIARGIVEDLESAESCEQAGDFIANMQSARDQARELIRVALEIVKP